MYVYPQQLVYPHPLIAEARRAEFEAEAEQARLARIALGPRRPSRIRVVVARGLVGLAGRLDARWRALVVQPG